MKSSKPNSPFVHSRQTDPWRSKSTRILSTKFWTVSKRYEWEIELIIMLTLLPNANVSSKDHVCTAFLLH